MRTKKRRKEKEINMRENIRLRSQGKYKEKKETTTIV